MPCNFFSQICVVALANAKPQTASFSGSHSGSAYNGGSVVGAQKNENPTFNYFGDNFYHNTQGNIDQIEVANGKKVKKAPSTYRHGLP